MITLELSVECPDEASARALMEAVGPDNGGYVESELHGCEIVFRMGSESAGTLRNTADDLMACLKTASEAAGIGRSGERLWNPRLQKSRKFRGNPQKQAQNETDFIFACHRRRILLLKRPDRRDVKTP